MSREQILVVEDEEDILDIVVYNLEKDGFKVTSARNGEAAIKKVRAARPDLILLDLMLPGIDGLSVCREIKAMPDRKDVPIIMLTAKSEEVDIVTGLEVGADDYITKPFSQKVLTARIRALLRRKSAPAAKADKLIKLHGIELDPKSFTVKVKDKDAELTFTEFRILQTLMQQPGIVLTRYQIVDAIRGGDYAVTERAVDVQIAGLRKKLGSAGEHVETVRSVGYKFRSGE